MKDPFYCFSRNFKGVLLRPVYAVILRTVSVLVLVSWCISFEALGQGDSAATFVSRPAEDFLRGAGAPVTVTRTFEVLDRTAPYTLRLYNGGRNSEFSRVSSAVITLNGGEILRSNDFNQQVDFIERHAPLLPKNTFTVELRSQRGSGITIEFIGIDNAAPQIVASVNPPPNAAGWNNTSLTVSFACSRRSFTTRQAGASRSNGADFASTWPRTRSARRGSSPTRPGKP